MRERQSLGILFRMRRAAERRTLALLAYCLLFAPTHYCLLYSYAMPSNLQRTRALCLFPSHFINVCILTACLINTLLSVQTYEAFLLKVALMSGLVIQLENSSLLFLSIPNVSYLYPKK
jgi:hypothetical protein